MSSIFTAYNLEKTFPNRYSSLFIHIKTKFELPCSQLINMDVFRNNIKYNELNIITDGPMFFDKSKFGKQKDYVLLNKNQFLTKNKDYNFLFKERFIKFHQKKNFNVIEKFCVVLNCRKITNVKNFIREHRKDLLKRAISYRNKNLSIFSNSRLLPTKYIRVLIYSNDYRERTFKDFNFLSSNNLLAIIHLNSSKQINNILPVFGEREKLSDCDIFWSKTHKRIN